MTKATQLLDGHQRDMRLAGSGGQIHDRVFSNANVLHLALVEPGTEILFRCFLGRNKKPRKLRKLHIYWSTYVLELYLDGLHCA